MSKFHKVTNDEGKVFLVKIVRQGETYGRNGCLVNDSVDPDGKPYGAMVEFYDYTRPNCDPTFPGHGQFASRYYASTLLDKDRCQTAGLNLDGGVPAWSLDAGAFNEAMKFAADYLDKAGIVR